MTSTTKNAERAASIKLPEPKLVEIPGIAQIEYLDVGPEIDMGKTPTVVLIHGNPGVYHDFRYLIPYLQKSVRVIGLNLPGFGRSKPLGDNDFYDLCGMIRSSELAVDALERICSPEEEVFMLSHSLGSHTLVHISAIALREQRVNIKGLIMLAPAGLKPHQAASPHMILVLAALTRSKLPVVEASARWASKKMLVDLVGFSPRYDQSYYVAGIMRGSKVDFQKFAKDLAYLREVPAFFAWSTDDELIESAICQAVVETNITGGPRIIFQDGGHNIQKTKAKELGEALTPWIAQVSTSRVQSQVSKL